MIKDHVLQIIHLVSGFQLLGFKPKEKPLGVAENPFPELPFSTK